MLEYNIMNSNYSSSNSEMIKVAIVVQQIITEVSEDVSEEDEIMVVIKAVLN
jgi:hypothetical protein